MPTVLAFDTSGPYCAAALLIDDKVTASSHQDMTRGQAERLFPMLDEVLGDIGAVWEELDAIGVGIGPGNFTGTRIAVSAARGLALSLGIPAIGITNFEIVRHLLGGETGPTATLLPAPRDQVYVQFATDGQAQKTAQAPLADFICHTFRKPPALISIADPMPEFEVYHVHDTAIDCDAPSADLDDFGKKAAPVIAQIAATRLGRDQTHPRPAPLYIRPADAAPSREPPITILP